MPITSPSRSPERVSPSASPRSPPSCAMAATIRPKPTIATMPTPRTERNVQQLAADERTTVRGRPDRLEREPDRAHDAARAPDQRSEGDDARDRCGSAPADDGPIDARLQLGCAGEFADQPRGEAIGDVRREDEVEHRDRQCDQQDEREQHPEGDRGRLLGQAVHGSPEPRRRSHSHGAGSSPTGDRFTG